MKRTHSNLPMEDIQDYWDEVVRLLLQEPHRVSMTNARRATSMLRRALVEAEIGDIFYHAPIDQTIEMIIKGGYIPPTKATSKKSRR